MRRLQTGRDRRRAEQSAWIDVTGLLRTGTVRWPGNPPEQVRRVQDLNRGDECTLTALSLGVHSGTHMDAPRHFLRSGPQLARSEKRGVVI